MFAFKSALLALMALGFFAPAMADKNIDYLAENKKKDGVTTLASGLQYKVLRKGDGMAHPTVSSPCECHYRGKLIDGEILDCDSPSFLNYLC